MPEFDILEAEKLFFELLKRAQKGEQIIITRNGKVAAELVSINPNTESIQTKSSF